MKPALVTGLYLFSFLGGVGFGRAQIPPTDARYVGLGGAAAAAGGAFGARGNPAALSVVESASLSAGHTRPFGISEVATSSAEVVLPFGLFVGGLSISGFGYEAFAMRALSTTMALSGGSLAAGVRIGFRVTSPSGYDGRTDVLLETGWRYSLSSRMRIAGTVGSAGDGTTIEAGISASPGLDSEVLVAVVATKGRNPDIRFGIEMNPVRPLVLRLGVRRAPILSSVGVGLALSRVAVDFAASHHPRLGSTVVVTVRIGR